MGGIEVQRDKEGAFGFNASTGRAGLTRESRTAGAVRIDERGRHPMFVGVLELDLLLGDVHSLKEKRGVVRPIVAEVRKRFEVSVAEAGHLDLHRRALIGVAIVAPDAGHCAEVMAACERLVAARPEVEVLSARQRLVGEEDD